MTGGDAVGLVELGASTDPALVGHKAARLATVMKLGIAVPPGVVVPTGADGLAGADLAELLTGVVARLGGRVAVRSSAVVEDLPDASAAGQFLTTLHVTDDVTLVRAVLACQDGARAASVAAYLDRVGGPAAAAPGAHRTAVLVQAMLAPTAAGVASTRDPVRGADHVVLEAVAGIGDVVTAGAAEGERWAVERGPGGAQRHERGSPRAQLRSGLVPSVLDERRACEVAALAWRLEAQLGRPVDVEWAITGGRCHVLQVRPSTALPTPPPLDLPPRQTFVREPRVDEPLTPLSFSAWHPLHAAILTRVFEELGFPVRTLDTRHLHGRVYTRMVPLGDGGRDGVAVPVPLLRLLFLVVPALRRRLDRSLPWRDPEATLAVVERWRDHERAALRDVRRTLRDRDLAACTDHELAVHLAAVLAHVEATGTAHFRLAMLGSFLWVGRLGTCCEERLGWEPVQVLELLQGYAEATTEPMRAVEELVVALGEELVARAQSDPEVLRGHPAVDAYLDRHGHRVIGELRRRSETEDLGLLVDHLRRCTGARRGPRPSELRQRADRAAARARDALTSPSDRVRFDRTLEVTRRVCQYGDESELDTYDAITLVRHVALAAGPRLVGDGRLRRPDDVWFLDVHELAALLRDPDAQPPSLTRRRGEHAWSMGHRAPDVLGPAPLPPLPPHVVPRRWRDTVGAAFWAVAHEEGRPVPVAPSGRQLAGVGAAPGRAVGSARIVRSPADFGKVRAGDVVVCPIAVASWSAVLGASGAIVAEHGGLLSHTATLGREYGIPTVLGIAGITERVRDGDRLRVDGAAGTVELL